MPNVGDNAMTTNYQNTKESGPKALRSEQGVTAIRDLNELHTRVYSWTPFESAVYIEQLFETLCASIRELDATVIAPTGEIERLRQLLRRALPMASALDATHTAVVWTADLQCDATTLVRDIRAALRPLGAGVEASEQRPRFVVSDGGRIISDDDFIFDSFMSVSGDFGDDALRARYSQWVCDALNKADKTLPRVPRGAAEARDLKQLPATAGSRP